MQLTVCTVRCSSPVFIAQRLLEYWCRFGKSQVSYSYEVLPVKNPWACFVLLALSGSNSFGFCVWNKNRDKLQTHVD